MLLCLYTTRDLDYKVYIYTLILIAINTIMSAQACCGSYMYTACIYFSIACIDLHVDLTVCRHSVGLCS